MSKSTNICGAGWHGLAERTSMDTMGQMQSTFRNIVTMLHGVRDGLIRDAPAHGQKVQSAGNNMAGTDAAVGSRWA